MTLKRMVVAVALLAAFWGGGMKALQGQGKISVRKRITEPVDNRRTIRLPETTHARIRRARDNGRVPADLPMERAILALKSSPEQEADLDAFLAQQQDPSSPHYHEWLTPEQFGERFGASAADIGVIAKWLQAHGMSVSQVANGRR